MSIKKCIMNYFDKATNAMVRSILRLSPALSPTGTSPSSDLWPARCCDCRVRADYGLCHGQADEDAAQCLRGEVQH
mgnify:CR=1 FL=1